MIRAAELPAMNLPRRQRGCPTADGELRYREELGAFCQRLIEIETTLDFRVGSRGWCYLLENAGGISKGDFDAAQRLINDCRKNGDLPLNICADDDKRAAAGLERLDFLGIDAEADHIISQFRFAHLSYTPISFWKDLDTYVEMAVEKGGLKNHFGHVCREFRIVCTNVGGWADLNWRAATMRRFRYHEDAGRRIVLLYCGDHDPGELQISGFLRSNFEDLAGAVGWRPDKLIIDRFGLNGDFIAANNLLWIDNLETSAGKSLADRNIRTTASPMSKIICAKLDRRRSKPTRLLCDPKKAADYAEMQFCDTCPRRRPATMN